MRNKTKCQNTFPPHLPSSRAQLHSRILYLPHPAVQGDGEWGLRSVDHTLSLPLHPLQGQHSSHSSPAPARSPSHRRQSSTNFSNGVLPMGCRSSQTAPAWVPSTACSPSGADCSSVGPPRGHKSCQKTCSVGSSLHGSTGPARNLLQWGLPTGSQPPSGIHLFRHGVLHGLQVDICSTVDLHELQGDSLPHHGLPHGLQGNLCSGTWSISSSSFFTDLGVCRVVSLTFQSSLCCRFPLLKSVLPEALPPLLMGSALASGRSILEPAGIGSWGTWGKLLAASHRSHPL